MGMTDQQIAQLFHRLIDDRSDPIPPPLLAHYTSIDVLEEIMKHDEIWLSNPLFMNDLEKVRFGIREGRRLFLEGDLIAKACGKSDNRAQRLKQAFSHYYDQFEQEHAFDIYVFCLSEHDPKNVDGVLSMWRAYGGQGNGAALVFSTNLLTGENPSGENPSSPLILTKVRYGSREQRIKRLERKIIEW